MNELLFLLMLVFLAGCLPTMLAVQCVWKQGPKVMTCTGVAVAILAAALSIHFVADPPFFTGEHMFWGALVFLSGMAAVRLTWLEKHAAAKWLPRWEATVNKVLETQWSSLDTKGVGFLSQAAVRARKDELERQVKKDEAEDNEDKTTIDLSRVVYHIWSYFDDIAVSSEGTYFLTPAVAHNYIAGVNEKYHAWIKPKKSKQTTVVV